MAPSCSLWPRGGHKEQPNDSTGRRLPRAPGRTDLSPPRWGGGGTACARRRGASGRGGGRGRRGAAPAGGGGGRGRRGPAWSVGGGGEREGRRRSSMPAG